MMHFILMLSLTFFSFVTYAKTGINYRPVAFVNDIAITPHDINKRITLIRFLNNIPFDKKVLKKERYVMLQNIVAEALKAQEIKKFDVTVQPDRLKNYIDSVARKKNMSSKEMINILVQYGISQHDIEKIYERELAWKDLVRGRFGRTMTVNSHEMSQVIETIIKTGDIQVDYDYIFIPVNNANDISKKQDEARMLMQRLNEGENFKHIAVNYHENLGTPEGFQSLASIPQILHSFLIGADDGDMSQIIPDREGLYIVKLNQKKSNNQYDLSPKIQAFTGSLYKEDEQSNQELQEILSDTLNKKDPCKIFDDVFSDIEEYPLQKIEEYPTKLQSFLRRMEKGSSTITENDDTKINILTVCAKEKIDYYNDVPSDMKEKIHNQMVSHKLILKEKEYLKKLREKAVINIHDYSFL